MQLNPDRAGLKNLIVRIPKSQITGLGKILGYCLYYFDVPHRRIVRRNLQFTHPEWSRNQIQSFAKRFCQHFGITILEMIQMTFFSRRDMLDNVRIEGQKHFIETLAKQKGVILISAHLGNWEMALQLGPCYFQQQITGVAKKLRNGKLDGLIHHIRTRFGNRILYKKGALPEMMRTLRQGKVVAVMLDISRRFDGVEVKFFGRRATATPAAALLALRCKSPVVVAFCYRKENGGLFICFESPVEMQRTHDLRSDLQTNTQAITERVERAIRNHPEQWLWTLKRWKDFYPELYPESRKRRQRIKKKGAQKFKLKL